MTDALASLATRPAGSKLYETWVASAAETTIGARRKARRASERDYRVITATAFPAFVAIAALARLLPPATRMKLTGGRRSVVADARAMVAATIPFAFMA